MMADIKVDRFPAILKTIVGSSARWKLDSNDLIKLWKSFMLTVLGAGVYALLVAMANWIPIIPDAIDWGSWKPLIALACPWIANLIRRFLTNYQATLMAQEPKD